MHLHLSLSVARSQTFLKPVQFQLGSSKATTNEHREHRPVPLAAEAINRGAFEQLFALVGGKPISDSYTQSTDSFYTADTGGQFRTEQTRVSSLIGNSSDFPTTNNA